MAENDPSVIVRVLSGYLGTAWEVGTGVPVKSDFERSQYDSVKDIFGVDFIIEKIENFSGNLPTIESNFPYAADTDDANVIIKQFLWIHDHVSKKETVEVKNKNDDGTST